jgi:dienelactone hydrolase
MEKELRIKTSDRKTIYGILRGSLNKPVIVQVHGLAGNMHEAMHYNAARYFEKQGFSSFRFNLYSWQKDARHMHECTFSTHGKDIDTVLGYLQKHGAKKIFIVGHSYGFPSILHAKSHAFSAVASWDGSVLPTNNVDVPARIKKPKGRILNEGYFVVVGEQMAIDSHKIKTIPLIKALWKPISFITVDDNVNGNLSGGTRMFKLAKQPKELVVIKGGTHCFTEDGKEEELYSATVKWFKKFK